MKVFTTSTSFGSAQIFPSAENIDAEVWRQCFSSHSKDDRYYLLVEQTLKEQFDFRYVLLQNNETGEKVVQPLLMVEQDLTTGLSDYLRSTITQLRRVYSRFLKVNVLMAGCAAGEGHLGSPAQWAAQALHEALRSYGKHARAPLVVLKDVPAQYRPILLQSLRDVLWRVPSMPAAKLELDFASFEEYMMVKLGSVFRKNLRRKFRVSSRYPAIAMQVTNDATPFIDQIYPLYLQTFNRSKFHFERLTKDFFAVIGARLPERTHYFTWWQDGRIIAFSLCLAYKDTLDDLSFGMDYSTGLDLHMYFITWRDVIQWALENNIKTYLTGQLNYDPKYHLRLDLLPLDLYVTTTSHWLRPLFRTAITYLQPTRHDPVLKRFPTFHLL